MFDSAELELIRDSINIEIEMMGLKGTDRYKKLTKIKSKVCQEILNPENKNKEERKK